MWYPEFSMAKKDDPLPVYNVLDSELMEVIFCILSLSAFQSKKRKKKKKREHFWWEISIHGNHQLL